MLGSAHFHLKFSIVAGIYIGIFIVLIKEKPDMDVKCAIWGGKVQTINFYCEHELRLIKLDLDWFNVLISDLIGGPCDVIHAIGLYELVDKERSKNYYYEKWEHSSC